MMRILLDTHTLVWLTAGKYVGPKALRTIQQADEVFVSALSVFELRIKQAGGKLPEAEDVIDSIGVMGFEVLNITEQQTKYYKIFRQSNKDPFDNGLVSVALAESLTLVTADAGILTLKQSGLVLINAKV